MEANTIVEREVAEALEADRLKVSGKTPNIAPLTKLLRVVGALVLLAAAASFLVQNWAGMSDIYRYLGFLGFTVVVAGCAFISSRRFSDDRGARTFLATAAAIVPVHFAQVGGLVYSLRAVKATGIPSYFVWLAPSAASAALALAACVIVLTPLVYLAFLALCRAHAKLLTGIYVLSNAALLIPVRSPDVVGFFILALIVALGLTDSQVLKSKSEIRTTEGSLIRLMLWSPAVLMICRTAGLYGFSVVLAAMLLIGVGIFMFTCVPSYVGKRHIEKIQTLSGVPMSFGWFLLCGELVRVYGVGAEFQIPLFGLPVSLLFGVMSCTVRGGGRVESGIAGVLGVGCLLLQLVAVGGAFTSAALVAISIAALGGGFGAKDRMLFYSGVFGFVIGLISQLRYALELCSLSPTLILGATGIVTVLAASYLEKNHVRIFSRVRDLRQELKSW